MALQRDAAFALFISFTVCSALCPVLIPVLQKLKIGQTEREEGVQSHLEKAGTPTMGGLMFLAGFLIACLVFAAKYPRIIPVMLLTIGFGVIGFVDDYLKVVLRRSDGLMPKQKMAGQILVTTIFVVYLWIMDSSCLEILIPFSGGKLLSGTAVRVIATPLCYFAVIGTVNGVNFTDGLDGLASSVTSIVACFFAASSALLGGGIETAAAAMLGALMGFLMFNVKPARVFMGDTGSLALGGFVAGCAYLLKMPLFIPIVGLIYLVEVLSVIIQVTYFKKTHGKRFFKMAPIHHHFEMCQWSEPRIVAVFTMVTVLVCIAAWLAILP